MTSSDPWILIFWSCDIFQGIRVFYFRGSEICETMEIWKYLWQSEGNRICQILFRSESRSFIQRCDTHYDRSRMNEKKAEKNKF